MKRCCLLSRNVRALCMGALLLSATMALSPIAQAEYTRIKRLDQVTLSDIKPGCDYRLRLSTKSFSSNYGVTFIEQSASSQSYNLDAQLTRSQTEQLLSVASTSYRLGYSSSYSSSSSAGASTPAHAIRVVVPLSGRAASISLQATGPIGSSTYSLAPSLFELDQECAGANPLPVAGGGDGCAQLAAKIPNDPSGKCVCLVENALSRTNPCPTAPFQRSCAFGPGGVSKCVGPVQSTGLYFFNPQSCGCEFCDPETHYMTGDRISCECKFNTLREIFAPSSGVPSPLPNTKLVAIQSSCRALLSQNSSGVYFDKSSCRCATCPYPKRANQDGSGCI